MIQVVLDLFYINPLWMDISKSSVSISFFSLPIERTIIGFRFIDFAYRKYDTCNNPVQVNLGKISINLILFVMSYNVPTSYKVAAWYLYKTRLEKNLKKFHFLILEKVDFSKLFLEVYMVESCNFETLLNKSPNSQ